MKSKIDNLIPSIQNHMPLDIIICDLHVAWVKYNFHEENCIFWKTVDSTSHFIICPLKKKMEIFQKLFMLDFHIFLIDD